MYFSLSICFALYWWNGFMFPDLMLGPKSHARAQIEKVQKVHIGKGFTYDDVHYYYILEGDTFRDHFHAGDRWEKLQPGEELKIEYLVNDPARNKVVAVYRNKLHDR
jgi:hypothetical protein